MTDYAEPVTPPEVCERIRESLRHRVESLRRDAEILIAKADAVESASREIVLPEKALYERAGNVHNGSPEGHDD